MYDFKQEWVNSLWPSDAIWGHLSGSTLAQVMACCLTAPSHYLNQCWLIFSQVPWYPLEGNCTKIAQPLITKIILKINNLKFHSNLPGDIELNHSNTKKRCVDGRTCNSICLKHPILYVFTHALNFHKASDKQVHLCLVFMQKYHDELGYLIIRASQHNSVDRKNQDLHFKT